MMPTYNANIPQPTDQISQSQDQILQNFQSIQALIDINHVDFASGDQGKHKWTTMPTQGAIPPAGSGFLAGEIGLYNAVNAFNSQNELYVNKTNQATVVQIPATASILSVNSAPSSGAAGWTQLPSGIIMRWGTFTSIAGPVATVSLGSNATIGPTLTQILTVIVTTYDASGSDNNFFAYLGNIISNTQFQVHLVPRTTTSGAATGGFKILVIGY
jgi:hypothetical protein